MNRLIKYVLPILAMALTSCFDKDIFPETPNIAFEDIVFYDGTTTDSLILTFSFEDGNGDIGVVESQDVLPPFNEFDVYLDSRDSVITEANIGAAVPPIYVAPLITENFVPLGIVDNTLIVDLSQGDYPILAFGKEFYSEDVNDIPLICPGLTNQDGTFLSSTTLTPYIIDENGSIAPADAGAQVISSSLPVQRIETYFNFIIEFQKKVGDNYVPLNYQQIFGTNLCDVGVFNGRIPQYDPEGKSGTFTYSIQSAVLRLAFLDDVIRAKFYVYDRAGNKSNEVTSPDFVLADITQ
ncbi:hypothetical protein [Ekhidna sp.]|uniref:hypothetical protein n=1 Tax=Ekhidna sp. TaxID=2608089 RepID=UPI0032971CAF